MWQKVGDFVTVLNTDGSILFQTVKYELSSVNPSTSPIFRLSFSIYPDGVISCILESSSPEQYKIIRNALRAAGFPKPDYLDTRLNAIALSQSKKAVIANFLMVLKEHYPTFTEIEAEIFNYLSIDATKKYLMPVWIKECRHHTTLFRSAETIEKDISCIEITSHRHDRFTLSITVTNREAYENLKLALIALGFPAPLDSEDKALMFLLFFNPDTLYTIELLLNFLRGYCCDNMIINDVQQAITDLIPVSKSPRQISDRVIALSSEQCDSPLKNFSLFETVDRSPAMTSAEPVTNSRFII